MNWAIDNQRLLTDEIKVTEMNFSYFFDLHSSSMKDLYER